MLWFPHDLRIAMGTPRWLARPGWRSFAGGSRLLERAVTVVHRSSDACVRDPELASLAFFAFVIGLTFLL